MPRNFFGAFADCAVLFPLLILLAARDLFAPMALFLSAGAAYVLAGAYFRIPMPVQPLKSIVVGALAVGASAAEIRWSAGILGVVCLLLVVFRWDSLLHLVPVRLVHEMQVGLGALLLFQAFRNLGGAPGPTLALAAALAALILLLPAWKGIPWMGVCAAIGMAYAVWNSIGLTPPPAPASPESFRAGLVASLVLPQLALTLANSVVGTRAAAQAYFGARAERVTYRSLCLSIGAGNVVTALLGGLPFCHGSGGLTAHVKGGATSPAANYMIGTFLFLLAGVSWTSGTVHLEIPAAFVGALLFVTGLQHLQLAKATARAPAGKAALALAFFVAAFTQNLLWVLGAGLVLEAASKFFAKHELAREER